MACPENLHPALLRGIRYWGAMASWPIDNGEKSGAREISAALSPKALLESLSPHTRKNRIAAALVNDRHHDVPDNQHEQRPAQFAVPLVAQVDQGLVSVIPTNLAGDT